MGGMASAKTCNELAKTLARNVIELMELVPPFREAHLLSAVARPSFSFWSGLGELFWELSYFSIVMFVCRRLE